MIRFEGLKAVPFRAGKTFPLRAGLAAVLAVPLLAVVAAPVNAQAPQTAQLRYQVAWGNLTLAEARVNYALNEENYEIEGTGESRGALGWLFSWKGSARTVGLTTPDGYRALRHDSEGSFNDRTRRTSVRWEPGESLPKLEAEPQPDLEEVTPVPAAETADTADPFTVLLTTLGKLERGDRCEAEARVWDGRRRYDLKIEHIGSIRLTPDRPWAYGGPAIGCRITFTRIGGFFRDSEWEEQQDDITRVVWVGRLEDQKLAPVRIELSAPIGNFVGRLYAQ